MSSHTALIESTPLRIKLHNREPSAGPSERYGITPLSVRGASARPAATKHLRLSVLSYVSPAAAAAAAAASPLRTLLPPTPRTT
jgi:hypothetical protein